MPTPQIDERAVIVIEGQEYSFWTAVVVERTVEDNVSTITLQTYESSPGGLPGRTDHPAFDAEAAGASVLSRATCLDRRDRYSASGFWQRGS